MNWSCHNSRGGVFWRSHCRTMAYICMICSAQCSNLVQACCVSFGKMRSSVRHTSKKRARFGNVSNSVRSAAGSGRGEFFPCSYRVNMLLQCIQTIVLVRALFRRHLRTRRRSQSRETCPHTPSTATRHGSHISKHAAAREMRDIYGRRLRTQCAGRQWARRTFVRQARTCARK